MAVEMNVGMLSCAQNERVQLEMQIMQYQRFPKRTLLRLADEGVRLQPHGTGTSDQGSVQCLI